MEEDVIAILAKHGIMSVATVRPDGWPQATIVSYVNEGIILYFLVSRTSQKFMNIQADPRVSITIGEDASLPEEIRGLSMAANASESRDEPYRADMLAKLSARHPGYFDPALLDLEHSALMRAVPSIISVVDYSQGLGHSQSMTVGTGQLIEGTPRKPDNWALKPALPPEAA